MSKYASARTLYGWEKINMINKYTTLRIDYVHSEVPGSDLMKKLGVGGPHNLY